MNESKVCSQIVVARTVSGQKLPCASLITHLSLNLFYRHSRSTPMSHLMQDCGILSCGSYIYVYLLNAKALIWSGTELGVTASGRHWGNKGEDEININKGGIREPFLLSSTMQPYLWWYSASLEDEPHVTLDPRAPLSCISWLQTRDK